MLNIEKYKGMIINGGEDFLCELNATIIKNDCVSCTECKLKTIEWLCQEYEEPILTDKEREYLKTVISPRRDDDLWVRKMYFYKDTEHEYTVVTVYGNHPIPHYPKTIWPLLNFITTADMPFKNMKPEKDYSPEELGL